MMKKKIYTFRKTRGFEAGIKHIALIIVAISLFSCSILSNVNAQEIISINNAAQVTPSKFDMQPEQTIVLHIEDIVLENQNIYVFKESIHDGIKTNPFSSFGPPVTIDKKVRESSDDPWVTSYTAPVGTVLQFKIWVKNVRFLFRDVVIIDIFPDNLDYVMGSASPAPDEYFNDTEEGMIWLMTIPGLTTYTMTYNAKIVAVSSDENQVTVVPLTGEDPDESSVTITGTSNPPYQPNTTNPLNGEIDVEITHALAWHGGDPNIGEKVTYDI